MNQKIINLRRELHKYPELSNGEYNTSERIINYMKEYNPDEIIRLGDTGLLLFLKEMKMGKLYYSDPNWTLYLLKK